MVCLAALHAYWAMGGSWGAAATIPTMNGQRTMQPGATATWTVAALLLAAALVICGRAGMLAAGRPAWVFHSGAWVITAVFLLRAVGNFSTFGFFKSIHGTLFAYWDSRLYSPLCLLLAALAGVVAAKG